MSRRRRWFVLNGGSVLDAVTELLWKAAFWRSGVWKSGFWK